MSEAELAVDEEAEPYSERSARLFAALLAVLSLAGAGVAGYLTYVHWFDKPIVCAGFSSCRQVADSHYAWVGGVPVAFLGLLGYLAIVAASAFWLRVGNRFDVWPLLAVWGMSVAGVAYSAYLTYVELFRDRRRLHLVRDVRHHNDGCVPRGHYRGIDGGKGLGAIRRLGRSPAQP